MVCAPIGCLKIIQWSSEVERLSVIRRSGIERTPTGYTITGVKEQYPLSAGSVRVPKHGLAYAIRHISTRG